MPPNQALHSDRGRIFFSRDITALQRPRRVKPDRIKVRFTKKGATRMGVTEMEVSFQIDGKEYSKLKDRLGKIFEGANCLVE